MQGLVQTIQTQAHTQAALQAQLEAQERADVWWASLLRTRFEDGTIDVAWDEFAASGDPLLLGGSLDLGEGFPNIGLKLASTENQEEGSFGGFLGLPKESFNSNLDSFGDFPRVLDPHIPLLFGAQSVFLHRQELGVKTLAAKISSLRPAIFPSNSLNGQTLPLSSSVQNSLVGDTPLEETVESDSERGE
ncbi:hypothetical protein Taro_037421 [Colocasia esculenta]|uniref:Uncharacterized protein n=1 Tax=Colocasia esculenta TaxID=4460 RepID=A0A843WCS7_COLES|nr:hypothetical protein [Colocasia esculenta]